MEAHVLAGSIDPWAQGPVDGASEAVAPLGATRWSPGLPSRAGTDKDEQWIASTPRGAFSDMDAPRTR